MFDYCDGKRSCSIDVDHLAEHAKHCPKNSYPYIDIKFNCIVETQKRHTCKNDNFMTVVCPENHLIMIKNIFFGQRAGVNKCDTLTPPIANCSVFESLKYVYSECEKRDKCELSWDKNNKCPIDNDLNSFLEVEYACVQCRNEKHNIKCNHLAKEGFCSSHPGWMYTFCRKTCWQCKTYSEIGTVKKFIRLLLIFCYELFFI